MKIYGISGLGADDRVFKFLTLNHELISIKWIEPAKNETIENYSLRLIERINTNEKFGIIGVSFGGLVAIEISKVLKPEWTILVSSVETKSELRLLYRLLGKSRILKFLPTRFFKVPRQIAKFLFGAKNSMLLYQILSDTNLTFAKWATEKLVEWENIKKIGNCTKISGEKDKLMPPARDKKTIVVKGGQHFMIVDKADEISNIINRLIK